MSRYLLSSTDRQTIPTARFTSTGFEGDAHAAVNTADAIPNKKLACSAIWRQSREDVRRARCDAARVPTVVHTPLMGHCDARPTLELPPRAGLKSEDFRQGQSMQYERYQICPTAISTCSVDSRN
jgi:hypothetical protein